MTEHNKILIKIILYTYLIITFISLSYFAEGWKYQMHSMIAIMLIMTILSGKHLMRWVQQFTGLSFFLTWYGLFILYMISGLLSIVILPIRIITLSISYFTEKRTEFHNYMITLQDSFRNIIINICLHQGYLITHEIDFLYKTPEIKNETIINSKQLALEIKENIDIVKNIGEIDYSKKEYFATSINKLNTFINKTDNSIHFDYYKTISYQNKVDSFFKIAVLSCNNFLSVRVINLSWTK